MKHLLMISLLAGININAMDCSGSRKSWSPCIGRPVLRSLGEEGIKRPESPELNRDYYLPPERIREEPKENDRKSAASHKAQSFTYQGRGTERLEGKRTQICDGGRTYDPIDLPVQRRRSSSATTTLSGRRSFSEGLPDSTQDLESRPATLCDRFRLSLAALCTDSRWIFVPTLRGHNLLTREKSFVDDEQPGLRKRTQVIDTRKSRPYTAKRTRLEK